ncbi:MAG: phosphoribosylglycinamide formyltransferase [Desulfamplus sp.]|nr:phosphoribosylglycinamide formyltransferase [Desulfamplus sp.]
MAKKIKIGTLISGGGTNLQAIIDSCADGRVDAQIMFTGSDVPGVKGLERAQKVGIDTFVVDYSQIIKRVKEDLSGSNVTNNMSPMILPEDFNLEEIRAKQHLINKDKGVERIDFFLKSRAVAEQKLLDHIRPYKIDLLVLAGFMRTLTPYFIDRINTVPGKFKIMNIHPALLPAFPGTDGYGDTFRYGCKVGGCTVHYIDYGEDTGPIIGQRAFQIEDGDTLELVKQKGLALEWQLYPECIQKFAQGLV